MPAILAALVAGLLFGLGLTVSDMVNPARVLAFLDVTGAWDPTLLFVLGGAVTMSFAGMQFVKRRMRAPVLAAEIEWPTATTIDRDLVGGAVLFGIGWGLVGLCPGPALAALVVKPSGASIFVLAMLAGMLLDHLVENRRAAGRRQAGMTP